MSEWTKKVICKIRKNWGIGLITLIFAAGGWVTMVEINIASGKDADVKHDSSISKLVDLQSRSVAIDEKLQGQLDIILRFLNVPATDSALAKWKAYPQAPQLDSLGKPVKNEPWLNISPDYKLGQLMKFVRGDTVKVQTLWDIRDKK